MENEQRRFFKKRTLYKIILALACLGLNLLLSFLARKFNYPLFPLYLDCVGTALATMLGGILPGVIVGFSTNLINSFFVSGATNAQNGGSEPPASESTSESTSESVSVGDLESIPKA